MSEKKEERKGGGVPAWMRSTARVGSRLPASGAGGTAAGWGARIHGILTGGPAVLLTVAAAIAVSFSSLKDLSREEPQPSGEEPPSATSAREGKAASVPSPQMAASGLSFVGKVDSAYRKQAPQALAGHAVDPTAGPGAAPSHASAEPGGKKAALPRAGYGRFTDKNRPPAAVLAGGGGLSGGIGRDFSQTRMNNSVLRRLEGMALDKASEAKRKGSPLPGAPSLKGASARRLQTMNSAMAAARGADPESAGAAHTRQWSNASSDGKMLSGPGVTGDLGRSAFSAEEGGDSGNPIDSGGPAPEPALSSPSVPPVSGRNATPYQKIVDWAQAALLAASGILLTAFLFGMWAKRLAATGTPPALASAASAYGYAKWLSYGAMAAAATVTSLGVVLLAQSQLAQGAIFTGIGGLLTYLSYTAADGNSTASRAASAARDEAAATGEAVSLQLGSSGMSAGGGAAAGGAGAAGSSALK